MEFEKNVEDEHSQSPGAREGMFLPKDEFSLVPGTDKTAFA